MFRESGGAAPDGGCFGRFVGGGGSGYLIEEMFMCDQREREIVLFIAIFWGVPCFTRGYFIEMVNELRGDVIIMSKYEQGGYAALSWFGV